VSPADLDAILATIPFGTCPIPGLVSAGQPGPKAFAAFATSGFKTVIDLRGPAEPRGFDEAAAVRDAGLDYVNLPVVGGGVADQTFDAFRALMRDPARRPVVVHCGSASRVGILLLPYFILDERLARDEAIALAMQAGLRSPNLADVALAYVDAQT